MKPFIDARQIYLHRDPVDFRKSIDGLSAIVELTMNLSLNTGALFLFCSKSKDKIKILYWDGTGFCLWYKRLVKERFKWPTKHVSKTLRLSNDQLHWLLSGIDIQVIKSHKTVNFKSIYRDI